MTKPLKIAAVVVVALLLVVVVVLLVRQTVPSTPSTTAAPAPTVPVSPKPVPHTVIVTERLPGTDAIDPAPPKQAEPIAVTPAPPIDPPSLPAPPPTTFPAPVPLETAATAASVEPQATQLVSAPATQIAKIPEPPSRPVPPATAPADTAPSYKVQPGDTLTSIAQKVLGSESRWHEIAEANPMVDPIKLRIGQTLKLPVPNSPPAATQPRDPSGRIIYIVRPLDSLASIAKQYYGTRELWKTIYSANRGVIGSNPDKLEPGTKLIIPPAPVPAR